MHHELVAPAEGVEDVRHRELDRRHLTGNKRLRVLEGVAELAPHRLSAHKLLVSAHHDARLWPDARVVTRVDVNQLDDKVGVGACRKWPLAFGLPVVFPEPVLGNGRFSQQNGTAPGRFGRFSRPHPPVVETRSETVNGPTSVRSSSATTIRLLS